MRRLLHVLSLAALLLALAPPAQAQVSFDVEIGPPPPAYRAYRVPPQPGPEYVWVEGYWYPDNGRYEWHNGYWTRPPYPDAYWVAPYYDGRRYYTGHWEGRRGEIHHDHGWDRDRDRDERWGYDERNPRGRNDAYDSRGRNDQYGRGREGGYGAYGPNASISRAQAQAIVRSAYQNVLGREPDPGSAGYVERVFNDHWSQQQVENELRNSVEYRQKHARR